MVRIHSSNGRREREVGTGVTSREQNANEVAAASNVVEASTLPASGSVVSAPREGFPGSPGTSFAGLVLLDYGGVVMASPFKLLTQFFNPKEFREKMKALMREW